MFIKKKLSISKIFFSNLLFIATLSSIVIGLVWINHEHQDFNKQSLNLKSQYLDTQKQKVKNAVENAINYVNYKKALTQERLKQSIKQRVYEAHGIAVNIYQNNSGKLSDNEIIKLIKQALGPVRFFDNRNYYFIDDLEGNSILFPPKPIFEGKNLMNIINKEGVRPFPEIIKLVKKNGEGYYTYNWIKYTEGNIATEEEFPKVTYFKLFAPYNWFIAVGEYLDYVENDIWQEVLERVSQINFENGEYVNIHTYDGVRLTSGGQALSTLVNEWEMVESKGYKIVQEQKKVALTGKGGFIFYDGTDSAKEKLRSRVSFAKSLPDSKWIISAGTYIDEVDQVIAQKKSILKKDVKTNSFKIIFIMSGLWVFAFILARYMSFKTKSSFQVFSHFFKEASKQATQIDQNALHFSEFSELAQSANQMIEKRHKAESMLQKSEGRFRQIAENIKEVFWIVSPDWQKVIYISPRYEEIWGLSCENLYKNPKAWMDSIDKEDFKRVSSYLKNKTSDDLSDIIFPEYKIILPNGTIRWILTRGFPVYNEAGEIDRIVGISEEITEQKQSEQAIQTLVESTAGITGQDFFDNVVQLLCNWLNCDIAIVGELENGTTIEAISMIVDGQLNHKFSYDLTGTPCEIVKKDKFCFFPENIVSLFPDDKDLVTINANGYIGTQIFNRKGHMIGVLNALSRDKLVIPKRAKEVLDIIAARVSSEIERKNAEVEKNKVEIQLQQAQKMESIGTLAGGIAHDFNNILFPIVGHTEMLIEDTPEDSPFRDSLDGIYTGAMRAKDLVKQILTFSRQEKGELKLMKMQPIIKEALKLLRSTIPTTIEIRQNIHPECGVIKADPTQIHQIIMNLATNAYHAMEETGGELQVSLKEFELGKQEDVLSPDMELGIYDCLTIADTGIGMDKDLIGKIFDPFYTTKEKGKGTGMGLSVVHGIVKNMNGAIHVYSEPGKGTEFTIYFPVEKSSYEKQSVQTHKVLQRGTEHILLVDDEKEILTMEKKMLERLGYNVTSRTSSIEALEAFRASPDKFDLVITDMAMPNMPGDKLSAELNKIRPDIPVLLCTGFSETMSEKKTVSLGIKSFLLKPIVMKDLSQKIREVLD